MWGTSINITPHFVEKKLKNKYLLSYINKCIFAMDVKPKPKYYPKYGKKKDKGLTRKAKKEVLDLIEGETEYKIKYYNQTLATADWTGVIYGIAQIGQNVTNQTRLGNDIKLKQIYIGLIISTAPNNWSVVRILVIQWFPASVPSTSDILTNTGNITTPINSVNWDNKEDFCVLWSKVVCISSLNVASLAYQKYINIKYAKKTISYDGSATTGNNQIYVLAFSDDNTANAPLVGFQSRLMFSDS